MRIVLTRFLALLLVWARCRQAQHCPTATPQIPCSLIGCCHEVNTSHYMSSRFKIWAARYGSEPDLIRNLSTGFPIVNLPDMNSLPINIEEMAGGPVILRLGVNVFRISSINQKTTSFKMHYILHWTWRDCRFTFLATGKCDYTLTVNDDHRYFHRYWRPLPRVIEREDDLESMRVFRHTIFSTGEVSFTEERVSYFRCAFDFTDLPFDKQNCVLTFLLPQWDAKKVELTWAPYLAVDQITTAEWEIAPAAEWKKSRAWKVLQQVNNSQLKLKFSIERRSTYLVSSYVVPAILFYCVSWVGLWIDASSVPARAAVGVIPILILTTNGNSLRSSLPPISYSTRLNNFITLTLVFTVIHMLEFGVVNYTNRRVKFLDNCKDKYEMVAVAVQPHMEVSDEQPIKAAIGRYTRLEMKCVRLLHDYLDSYTRAVSIVAYSVGSALCLLAG